MRTGAVFPLGTMVINVSGSFLMGLWMGLGQALGGHGLLLLDVGFTGAYTTFSTFSFETGRLLEQRLLAEAVAYQVGSVSLGLLAVMLGHWTGGAIA